MSSLRNVLRPFRIAVQSAGKTPRPEPGLRLFHVSRPHAAVYSKANKETLEKVLKESEDGRVVLVDFYADWCQPCHMLSPVLEKYSSEPNTSANGTPVDLVKIDTEADAGQALAIVHKVQALPTVFVYKGGKLITHFKGALPEAQVKQILDSL